MDANQNTTDMAIDRIVAAIDRGSPVSLSVQLRGALEFGIASGDLPAGTRMPTIRHLAQKLAMSPVTVSNVYAGLQSSGLIEGRVGAGTFVKDEGRRLSAQLSKELDERIVDLVRLAQVCGVSREELALRVSMAPVPSEQRSLRVLVVGNFAPATGGYADEIRPYLPKGDEVFSITYAQFARTPPKNIDFIVTTATLQKKVEQVTPDVPVLSLTMLVNRVTRVALASIPSESKVLAYSYFSSFVTAMRAGVGRYAPQIAGLKMIVRGERGLDEALAEADVVVYASGAEFLREKLRPDQSCFEYRHTPDRHSIETKLLPALDALRTTTGKFRK
ncbi:GntR family transcriptional regulator [Rhodobacteraceae bacterium RKSG542]|uniref:GntR family transcriptional regulator n=1 Tax=Pseudovibrio flavus TaxID=2529854 RepID=UPI0012BB7A2C|nr:GntR family transcriptional regulator [Pseudovibrio flavus]MTI18128.1 GntR family transcriptional regulator [Pseudovibrio flavus]